MAAPNLWDNRCDTRWLEMKDKAGSGIRFSGDVPFEFSALHYTDKDLFFARYGHDLGNFRRAETILNINAIQMVSEMPVVVPARFHNISFKRIKNII